MRGKDVAGSCGCGDVPWLGKSSTQVMPSRHPADTLPHPAWQLLWLVESRPENIGQIDHQITIKLSNAADSLCKFSSTHFATPHARNTHEFQAKQPSAWCKRASFARRTGAPQHALKIPSSPESRDPVKTVVRRDAQLTSARQTGCCGASVQSTAGFTDVRCRHGRSGASSSISDWLRVRIIQSEGVDRLGVVALGSNSRRLAGQIARPGRGRPAPGRRSDS